MKTRFLKSVRFALAALVLFGLSEPRGLHGQIPGAYPAPPPMNQRQLLERFQTQLRFFDDAIQNAPRSNMAPDALLWQQFDGLSVGLQMLERSLSPAQLNAGANDFAELEAGLGIISEAFPNFQEDLRRGRSGPVAVHTLCQVLRDSMKVWTQQFNQVAKRLQIGR